MSAAANIPRNVLVPENHAETSEVPAAPVVMRTLAVSPADRFVLTADWPGGPSSGSPVDEPCSDPVFAADLVLVADAARRAAVAVAHAGYGFRTTTESSSVV